MVAINISVWTIPEVAAALHKSRGCIARIVKEHGLGVRPAARTLLEPWDVHCIAWCLKHPRYRGKMPWTYPEAPKPRRRKLFSTADVARRTGYSHGWILGMRVKNPSIGQKIGPEVIFIAADIKRLQFRRENRWQVRPDHLMIRDPTPQKILLDSEVITTYDGFVEEKMVEKSGNRKRNLVSVYLSDELVAWLEKRRVEQPYLSKSQAVNQVLEEVRRLEEKSEQGS